MKIITAHFPSLRHVALVFGCAMVLLFVPLIVWGADFVLLAGLPKVTQTQPGGLANYLNKIYLFLIVVGSIIAAIRISVAGAEYAFTDIVTSKEEAKKHIYGVLIGLLILLLPYLVLSTIYPALTNLDILRTAGDLKSTINKTPPPSNQQGGNTTNVSALETFKKEMGCGQSGVDYYGVSKMCCYNTQGDYKCAGDVGPGDVNTPSTNEQQPEGNRTD